MRSVLVRIEAGADQGFAVQLFEDSGREDWLTQSVASAELPADLPLPDLPEIDPKITGTDRIREYLLHESGEADHLDEIGEYLYGLLATGAVGTKLERIADAARPDGVRMLLDVRPPDLAKLPWELTCRGTRRLATDTTGPVVRVTSGYPGAGAPRPVRWPLRVMVVVGSEEDDRVVAAQEEIANLAYAFRRLCGIVEVEFVQQKRRDDVRRIFRDLRPHIFHFIGHGSLQNGRGRLMLFDPQSGPRGQNKPWTPDSIRSDLAGWQPQLAILNACRTESVDEQGGAWSVAEVFRDLGAPAVVAMQADIDGLAAARFTGELYRSLADGEPLDVAVTQGRLAITDDYGVARRDFALPSLSVSFPPESILRMRFGPSDEVREHAHSRLPQLPRNFVSFVDRSKERRRLWQDLDPHPDPDPRPLERPRTPAGAFTVVGRPQVGKSSLARWCVDAFRLHGGNAAYVNLRRDGHLGGRAALQAIAEELSSSPAEGESNRRAFEQWFATLPDAADDDAPPPDVVKSSYSLFGDALREAAAGRPLLIALDHLDGVQTADIPFVRDWLLLPIAARALAPVRLIVVLSEDQRAQWLTSELADSMPEPIELTRFKPSEFRPIARQYLLFRYDVEVTTIEHELADVEQKITEEFGWEELDGVAQLARLFGWSKFDD